MSPHPKILKRHPEYFHEGGDVRVIINDTVFCIASHYLTRESPVFSKCLDSKPEASGSITTEPCVQVQEVVILPTENVSIDDFAKLCWVFYNKTFSIYDTSLDTWETILRLANQYQFPRVKDLAFREISASGKFDLSLVNRIVFYKKYNAEFKYLMPLYTQLLSRGASLTLEEGKALGLESALAISGAREILRATSDKINPSAPLPHSMKDAIVKMVTSLLG